MTLSIAEGNADRLRVVVMTCGDLGVEIANDLAKEPAVHVVGLITAPWPRFQSSLRKKIRQILRNQGWGGLLQVVASHLRPQPENSPTGDGSSLQPGIAHVHVADFHGVDALEAIQRLRPDIGVLAGTYILREVVFALPRLGCINLHSGKVPEYRGASPAFWELYNGEPTVGITVHRVSVALDAGDVLCQELFALDIAPTVDPMLYLEQYRRDVLRPNGIRILTTVVRAIAAGTIISMPQEAGRARTYRTPDYKSIQELKRRVQRRRRE